MVEARLRRTLAALSALVIATVGCANPGGVPASTRGQVTVSSPATAAPSGEASPSDGGPGIDAEMVDTGEALGQVRGHLFVSQRLYRVGDLDGANVHANHPRNELSAIIAPEVEIAGGDRAAFEAALRTAAGAVDAATDAADLEQALQGTRDAADAAERSIAGEAVSTPRYVGSVVARLVATTGHEYEEAFQDGQPSLLVEYQDAFAFVSEAERLYLTIAGQVEGASEEEAAEIEGAFDALKEALPGPAEPDSPPPAEQIVVATALIGHELEETVGALPVEEADAAAEVAEIERLVEAIVRLYEDGDPDGAAELAAQAYLEHYEVIEAEVIALAPAVNTELEPLLGADLRRRISEGASVDEIRSMVARAKELLAQALAALEAA